MIMDRSAHRLLIEARPDIWRLMPLSAAKGIKKPSDKKLADGKALWSGGPWGGMITSFQIIDDRRIDGIGYSWRYCIGKARLGYFTVGWYERVADQVVKRPTGNGVDFNHFSVARKWEWRFYDDFVAARDLLPEMVPPKKLKLVKLDESDGDMPDGIEDSNPEGRIEDSNPDDE